MIKLSNWNKKLYTEKNTARDNKNVKTSDVATLVAHRILSTQDEDMNFVNQVKLSNATNGTDDRDQNKDDIKQVEKIKTMVPSDEMAQARATITPPTGADRQTIIMYIVAGTLALAMLSTGVVVIKKYMGK